MRRLTVFAHLFQITLSVRWICGRHDGTGWLCVLSIRWFFFARFLPLALSLSIIFKAPNLLCEQQCAAICNCQKRAEIIITNKVKEWLICYFMQCNDFDGVHICSARLSERAQKETQQKWRVATSTHLQCLQFHNIAIHSTEPTHSHSTHTQFFHEVKCENTRTPYRQAREMEENDTKSNTVDASKWE